MIIIPGDIFKQLQVVVIPFVESLIAIFVARCVTQSPHNLTGPIFRQPNQTTNTLPPQLHSNTPLERKKGLL